MGRLWCHLLPILVVRHLEILTVILEGGDKNSNLSVNWRITLALRILVVIMFKYFCFASKMYIEVIEVKHHIFFQIVWLGLSRLKISVFSKAF